MLWFERVVVGALVTNPDQAVRSSVEAFVDGTLRDMPEPVRAGVAAESLLLGAYAAIGFLICGLLTAVTLMLSPAAILIPDRARQSSPCTKTVPSGASSVSAFPVWPIIPSTPVFARPRLKRAVNLRTNCRMRARGTRVASASATINSILSIIEITTILSKRPQSPTEMHSAGSNARSGRPWRRYSVAAQVH